MPRIAVNGDVVGGYPDGICTSGQSFFTINGVPVLNSPSTVAEHNASTRHLATTISGDTYVTVNLSPVVLDGDVAGCSDAVGSLINTFVDVT